MFPDLSEDVWFLYAEGYGGQSNRILFSVTESFKFTEAPPQRGRSISISDLARWNYRLRPFLLADDELDLYRQILQRPFTSRLGELARVGIGYVTGANDF